MTSHRHSTAENEACTLILSGAPAGMVAILRVRLDKDEGHLLAQCIASPSIIVSGRNRTEVRAKIKECVGGYVEAYPEAKRKFFAGHKMKKVVFVEAR